MKKLILVLLASITPMVALASTAGPSFPGTVTTINNFGGNTWSNTGNLGSTNGAFAACPFNSGFSTTADGLVVSNFGFSIPGTAVINGISASIVRKQSVSGGTVNDQGVQLLKALTPTGANKANTSLSWPSSFTTASYGSTSDLWSTTWSASDINGTGFGLQLDLVGTANGLSEADVDSITITITYTASNNFTKTASETVTISPSVGLNRQAAVSETVATSLSVSAIHNVVASTPEGVSISLAVSALHNSQVVISDTTTLGDTSSRTVAVGDFVTESITINSSVLRAFPRLAGDTLTTVDSLSIRQTLSRTFNESISISLSGVGSASSVRSISDSVLVTDTPVRIVALGRSLSDSSAFSDPLSKLLAVQRSPSESLNVSQIVTKGLFGKLDEALFFNEVIFPVHMSRPAFSETAGVSASVLAILPRFKVITENLVVSQLFSTVRGTHRQIFDVSVFRSITGMTNVSITPHAERNVSAELFVVSDQIAVVVRSSTRKRSIVIMSL